MKRSLALLAGAAAGAVAAAFVRRRGGGSVPPASPDPRAEDLRRKLAEARERVPDEDDFEVAGMAGETIVEDEPGRGDAPTPEDVEAARRRVHEEARAAAEEMRRAGGPEAT